MALSAFVEACWDGDMPRTRGERHRHPQRGRRQVEGGQTKGRLTRGRESRGASVGRLGYWLRRPELSIAVGILATASFVVMAIAVGQPWILMAAVFILGMTVLVWFKRGLARDNAENARRGNRPFD